MMKWRFRVNFPKKLRILIHFSWNILRKLMQKCGYFSLDNFIYVCLCMQGCTENSSTSESESSPTSPSLFLRVDGEEAVLAPSLGYPQPPVLLVLVLHRLFLFLLSAFSDCGNRRSEPLEEQEMAAAINTEPMVTSCMSLVALV